ncbi:MAG: carboxylesterase family protein [Gammaproteobacteria bacterium]|nr:carboxylesterase family protein [Gammaproteobacteria bacterium]
MILKPIRISRRHLLFSVLIILGSMLFLKPIQSFAFQDSCATPIVNSPSGPVCGAQVNLPGGGQANAYRGIPFAESTAFPNRWKPPVAKAVWSETFLATDYGAPCPQLGVKSYSEDCLSLNIWTPTEDVITNAGAGLPVMVFIYGGSFTSGDAATPMYNGAYIAASKNLIVVNLNYRLGALGFLAAEGLNGNYGFLDQQLGLKWVQQNISSFGGDPERVTIFGESAGAMSVGLHLLSAPDSKPLFHAGIMESNLLSLPYKSLADQRNVGDLFKQAVNCRDVSCLEQTGVGKLLLVQATFTPEMSQIFSGPKYYLPFAPAIDGDVIVEQPIEAVGNPENMNKPIIIGTNKNEGVTFVRDRSIKPEKYATWMANIFGEKFQRVIEQYPSKQLASNSALWARVQTEDFFHCSTRWFLKQASAPVFGYYFDHQPSFNIYGTSIENCAKDDNVCHAVELPFVFNTASLMHESFTEDEKKLSHQMIDYWTNFAIYLNPNGGGGGDNPEWPHFQESTKQYMEFNLPVSSVVTDPYEEECDFWDSIGYNLVSPWQ